MRDGDPEVDEFSDELGEDGDGAFRFGGLERLSLAGTVDLGLEARSRFARGEVEFAPRQAEAFAKAGAGDRGESEQCPARLVQPL